MSEHFVKIRIEDNGKEAQKSIDGLIGIVKELDKTEAEIKIKNDRIQEAKGEIIELEAELKKLQQEKITIQADTSLASLDPLQYRGMLTGMDNAIAGAKGEMSDLKLEIKEATLEKQGLVDKTKEYKSAIASAKSSAGSLRGSLESVGTSLKKSLGTLTRYTVSLLGIRSLYLGLQKVANAWMNSGQEGAEQLKADINSMMVMLGSALAPAIKKIVDYLALALAYLNVLLKFFFGISLNADSTSKSIDKSVKGAKALNKELKRQLASFDEMNKLNEDGSTSGVGGGGIGSDLKPFVLPEIDEAGFTAKLEKLVEFWDKWKVAIVTVLALLGTLGILLSPVGKGIVDLIAGFSGLGKGAVIGGISLLVAGVVALVGGLGNLILNWDTLSTGGKVLSGVLAVLGGAMIAFGLILLGVSGPIAWLVAGIALLVAGVGLLAYKLLTEEKAILSTGDAMANLEEAQKSLTEANDNYVGAVDRAEASSKRLTEAEKKAGETGESLFNKVEGGILTYADMNEAQKELYKSYIDNETQQKNLEEATKLLTEAKQKEKIASWESQLAVHAETGSYEEYKNKVVEAFNKGELSAEEARDLIGKSMSGMSRDSQRTFMQDLPNDIKNGLNPQNYQTTMQRLGSWFEDSFLKIGQAWNEAGEGWKLIFQNVAQFIGNILKSVVNFFIDGINSFIRGINAMKVPDWVPAVGGKSANIKTIPRLAQGGIVTRPTQAIIGEAGREAVIPLQNNTDWVHDFIGVLNKQGGLGGGDMNITLINTIDGDEVARKTYKHIQMKDFNSLGTLY